MKTSVTTSTGLFDTLYPTVRSFLERDVSEYRVDGRLIRGYRSPDTDIVWLRDHVHQMKGFRHFEKDMTSAVTWFADHQRADGAILDLVARDGSSKRVPCEADVEYLLVEGVYRAWQATGDDAWAKSFLLRMERALYHSFSSPDRWSPEHGLVKRPFTIDTWDFIYNPDGLFHYEGDHGVDANTQWCVMHGDNSGMAHSCRLLGDLLARFGDAARGEYWNQRAERLRENLFKHCWNGRFFTHQVHLTPVRVDGVDESRQLSLSNAYALGRGVFTQEQAASVLREYQARRKETAGTYFAEWHSVHPPFPEHSFSSHLNPRKTWTKNPGEYVNGGVMPLVGGELAAGAFEFGFEEYGVDILRRYQTMLNETGKSYLWYHPDGRPGISDKTTLPTDGWGSASMLRALLEGLAGVRDVGKRYRHVRVAPRWRFAGVDAANVSVGYECSDSGFSYAYERDADVVSISWESAAEKVDFHAPVSPGAEYRVELDGKPIAFEVESVGDKVYLNFSSDRPAGKSRVFEKR